MELFIWDLRTIPIGEMYLQVLLVTLLLCWDYPVLVLSHLGRQAFKGKPFARNPRAPLPQAPSVLVVIPSLLRKRDELTSMMSTIESVATNGYPGALTIVVSIDGTSDAPDLYRELCNWAAGARWNRGVVLHVTGTPGRRSKPMAIEQAMGFVKGLVADGLLPAFPPVYVSTDADADLGPRALEAIVQRLQKRNWLTGAPARIVAGSLHVRGNSFWRGWRHFFTVEGQLNLQVAREYYVSNIWRHNIRAMPVTGVPGAFYCTWSEIFLTIPSFLGYLRTLRPIDWLGWWVGREPPRFSESKAEPVPELIAGDTDDTVTAYVGLIARYEHGRFVFDSPRSPIHALYYLLRALLIDRPIRYEPTSRVFTSSPTTVMSLLKQRKRWNSSRIELTLRFWRAIGFHWTLGLPVLVVKALLARSLIIGALVYLWIPFFVFPAHLLAGFVIGYACQVAIFGTLTAIALYVNDEIKYWRLALALPIAPFYSLVFNWLPGAIGATCDVLLFGNITGFSPEWTLKRGKSVRIALLFRLRRALQLAMRSVVRGDVPLGPFWLGWGETRWTPSGFEGWTTGRRPPSIIPHPDQWFPGLRSRIGRARRSEA
jgi:hypothetical protein